MAERITTDVSARNKEKIIEGKTVLVLGGNGMIGSRFLELYENGKLLQPTSQDLDITNEGAVRRYLVENTPDIIINFAAFTDVNASEKEKGDLDGQCWKVNVVGVKNIVENIDPTKTTYLHISTEMCLTGDGPFNESCLPETDPEKLTWYGYTKGEAERITRAVLGDSATIVRISSPVTLSSEKKMDFLRKAIFNFDRDLLKGLFADQDICITEVDKLCEVLVKIVREKIKGTFHVCSKDITSPFEFINYILRKIRPLDGLIPPTSVDTFVAGGGKAFRYPKHGSLDSSETQKVLGMDFGTTREIADRLILNGLGR